MVRRKVYALTQVRVYYDSRELENVEGVFFETTAKSGRLDNRDGIQSQTSELAHDDPIVTRKPRKSFGAWLMTPPPVLQKQRKETLNGYKCVQVLKDGDHFGEYACFTGAPQ